MNAKLIAWGLKQMDEDGIGPESLDNLFIKYLMCLIMSSSPLAWWKVMRHSGQSSTHSLFSEPLQTAYPSPLCLGEAATDLRCQQSAVLQTEVTGNKVSSAQALLYILGCTWEERWLLSLPLQLCCPKSVDCCEDQELLGFTLLPNALK